MASSSTSNGSEQPLTALERHVRATKEVIHLILIQELDSTIDLIDMLSKLRKIGLRSVCGIIRIYDYINRIADSSLILFVASEFETRLLIDTRIVAIKGQRVKVIPHDLVMKSVLNSDNIINNAYQLMLTGTFCVLRPILTDYLIMEMTRMRQRVPDFLKINGIYVPLHMQRQTSRNFMFLFMDSATSALELQLHALKSWKDGRKLNRATNSLLVLSKSNEYVLGNVVEQNKLIINNNDLQKLNFLSTLLR